MSVSPGFKYVCRFKGGLQWYMMESEDVISNVSFKLKNEKNQVISFNGKIIQIINQGKIGDKSIFNIINA